MNALIRKNKERLLNTLAATHVAGPELSDAISVCRNLALYGVNTTLCLWGMSGRKPRQVVVEYANALYALAHRKLHPVFSIKAPDFGFDFELLKDVLDVARSEGIFFRFDAQDPGSADPTFALMEKALAYYPHIGCTLPARWRRSFSDAERIVDLKIPVRIVKGQWPDSSIPHVDARASFLFLAGILAGRDLDVTIATHDVKLAAKSLTRLKESNSSCELEQMFGLPLSGIKIARSMGVPLRIYVPYGHPSLPYNFSEIRTRPAMLAWAVRDLILGTRGKLSRMDANLQRNAAITTAPPSIARGAEHTVLQVTELEEKI